MLLRARSLVRGSGVVRAGALRRMCTAVAAEAEEAAASPFSPTVPHNAAFYGAIFLSYCFTLRWQSRDKKLAAEIAEAKEAKAKEAPAAEVTLAVTDATPAAAPTSAVVKAAAAAMTAPAGATPAEWKVADVAAWLQTIELPMHADSFKAHSVNGKMLLALSDQDLYSTLQVTSPLHRKKLLMEISGLRKLYLS